MHFIVVGLTLILTSSIIYAANVISLALPYAGTNISQEVISSYIFLSYGNINLVSIVVFIVGAICLFKGILKIN